LKTALPLFHFFVAFFKTEGRVGLEKSRKVRIWTLFFS